LCLAYHHGTQLSGVRRNFLRICAEEMPRLLSSASKFDLQYANGAQHQLSEPTTAQTSSDSESDLS